MRIIFDYDIPYKVEIGEKISFSNHSLGVVVHSYTRIRKIDKIRKSVTDKNGSNELSIIRYTICP